MHLRWDPDAPGVADRTWHFPGGVSIRGAAPEHFGVTFHRRGPNAYEVRVLWNELSLAWMNLSRLQIMTCTLAPLLRSLGTDLWQLLDQPVEQEPVPPARVA
jgi:hypothetical protein